MISELSETVRAAGFLAPVVSDETELLSVCKSSLRGATRCYAAANFHSSTTQGPGGIWNYTLHADGSLGTKIFVNHDTNDQEIYILPFQHAIDSLIATSAGKTLPLPSEYPFTYEDNAQRAADIVRLYQGTVINILAVAFFLGVLGVIYQLTGHMAYERELGMSQLIEAMMPNKRRWEPQVARLLAYHAAFSIIYMPAWVLSGVIISGLVFPDASYAITIIYHVLLGLSLTSYSIFFGTFFKKAQLSGITATIVSIVLAIIAQIAVGGNGSTGAVIILSLLFPPVQYIMFLIMMAKFQQIGRPMNLVETPPNSDWMNISGIVLWIFAIIQIIVFPILGALVERALYGSSSTDRKLSDGETSSGAHVAVRLNNFNKVYGPGRTKRFFLSCLRRKSPQVHAVKDLTLDVVQGQIAILLGANGRSAFP
jgi:ATP-binding cassette subfamily A (ABC1) protein 3